jgi:tRNA U34 5-methylaminomethyl-2-thiouridine-forming methyltransferase MnmC
LKRTIIITADGSTTIQLSDWQEQYHSKHGAIQEASHVFVNMGLSLFFEKPSVSILEIGFGTGLNALLTLKESEKQKLQVLYEAVEAYPVTQEEVQRVNFPELLQVQRRHFDDLHLAVWEEEVAIIPTFRLKKRKQFFESIDDRDSFDLIYFDAFGARVQPELWTETIFKKMFEALKNRGVLVTYAAKGSVRRSMQAVGFTVERLPGPPGKREMLRATKP